MTEPTTFALFVVASLALLLTPGPAVLFVVARSVEGGTRAGLVSTLGLALGGLAHVAAAVLGISAILATSALLFDALRYAGAAYLIWLGLRALRAPHPSLTPATGERRSDARLLGQAALVNLLNPKPALFFTAFLPQFVAPASAGATLQLATLGAVFLALGLLTDSGYAVLAGSARRFIAARPRAIEAQRWLSGGTLISLGLAAATSDH